jgi:signal transduction histidine kinase
VILNIISNAKDALIGKGVENATIEVTFLDECVCIKDNAGGVPQDIVERIFEPYYTTKEQGKGTGLGLYMSKMIIEDNMGAKLSVKNGHEGAQFFIDFSQEVLKKEE